jgi:hypothetical protein
MGKLRPGFFFVVLEFELRTYTLSHSTSHFLWWFFEIVSWTVCPGWFWTAILLIAASWVARITGVSHQHLASLGFSCECVLQPSLPSGKPGPRAANSSLPGFPPSTILFGSGFFFFFCGTGIWTQGLYLEPFHQPFFMMGFFKIGSLKLFPQAGFEPQSSWSLPPE